MYRVANINGTDRIVKVSETLDINTSNLPEVTIEPGTWMLGPDGYFVTSRYVIGRNLYPTVIATPKQLEELYDDFYMKFRDSPVPIVYQHNNTNIIYRDVNARSIGDTLRGRIKVIPSGSIIMNNNTIAVNADRIRIMDLTGMRGTIPTELIIGSILDNQIDAIILPDQIIGDFDRQRMQVVLYAIGNDAAGFVVTTDPPTVPALELQAVIKTIPRHYLTYNHMASTFEIEKVVEYLPPGYEAIVMKGDDVVAYIDNF